LLCRDGKKKSYEWCVDHMVGIQRQRIEMDFETILKKLYYDDFLHFVFIHRKGFENWKDDEHRWCLEIGFVSGIHYLWIYIKEKEIPYFVEKYNLTPMRS